MATTAGAAVALNYGYNWITGTPLLKYTQINTGSDQLDYTRNGAWLLGDGEMDGLVEMYDIALGRLYGLGRTTGYDDSAAFRFHPGCDAVIGSGLYPTSTGGDQGVDLIWSHLPPGLQPLHYNRWAYYTLSLKWPINNPANDHQDDPSVWADLNPIGCWRGIRCRIFDATGAMTSYAFTRNPAWHYVDLLCRRKLFREYNIDQYTGADALPAAVRNRFDWAALADSAATYDAPAANGFASFAGDYSFSQKTSLQACLTQIAQNCRSFSRERSGVFSLIADKPRASVFTFSRKVADSLTFTVTDADLHSAPNVYTAKYRDLFVPKIADIEAIVNADHANPTVSTVAAHCAQVDDYVVLVETETRYDGNWEVIEVPSAYQMTLKSKGSNYPNVVGAAGVIGLRFSRFKERTPQFQHKGHQLARGAVGVGLPRQRNKVAVETDFANCTWDQVARVSAWQRAVALGPDVAPYVGPPKITLTAPLFAPDAAGSGAVAIQIEPGDRVTVDETLSAAYFGDYEVLQDRTDFTGSDAGSGSQRSPIAGGVQLALRPYSDSNYPDTAPGSEPGWPVVPALPGNTSTATMIPLEDGVAAFLTGSGAHGDSFELPDGFRTDTMICWASPQGFVEAEGQLHFIQDCDAYSNRMLSLIYSDGSTTWHGDVNYSALVWRSRTSVSVSYVQGVAFVELTLAGGEKVVFGSGVVGNGVQAPLPDGYAPGRTIAQAFPKFSADVGHNAHGFSSSISAGGIVSHQYQDGEGHNWQGPARVMLVGFRNNMGT